MLVRLLVRYLRPYWPLLIGVIAFQLLQSLASLYLPTLNADIIDKGVLTGDTGYIVSVGGLMLLVTLGQVTCNVAAVYLGAKAAMRLGRDLRGAVFVHVGDFSERELTRFGAPSLITRTTNDVQQIQMLVLMTCTLLVSAPILCIGGIALAMQQDLGLSWLIAVSVPVLLIAVVLIVTRMVPHFARIQARIDAVNRVLREQLSGIRVVRAFAREQVESERFDSANRGLMQTAIRAGQLFALMFPIVLLVLNVSSVAVLWFGADRIDNGSMQVGTLTAFLNYLTQILMGIMMATAMFILVPRAAVSAGRIGEVLDTRSTLAAPEHPVTDLPAHGTIELIDVSFAYPGAEKPVLSDINLRVESGQTIAIIGSTGAGKTTLIGLIARLFDATAGTVLVDGTDVAAVDPDVLCSRVGLVAQQPYLFTGTIASNLRYGKPDASDDELWRALDITQAKDFVQAMDSGLSAEVTQGGTNVSGGQRQRLAIARALVKRPEIYLFDDSFSALDLATDARLRRALHTAEKDATLVIVAQRVSTIVNADQIVVLEGGQIAGTGTHEQLLQTCDTYAEIVSSQLAAREAA